MSYKEIARDFMGCHTNPLNVALHLLTTPACFVTAFSILNSITSSCKGTQFVSMVYVLSLFNTLSFPLWLSTALATAGIGYLACTLQLSIPFAIGGFVAAYVCQDLAHYISGEITYQSTYMAKKNWVTLLVEHTYYLLPLCLQSVLHMQSSFLDLFVPQDTVVNSKLDGTEDKKILTRIRSWVMDQKPSEEQTTHWWFKSLEPQVKADFSAIADGAAVDAMFRTKFNSKLYDMKTLEGMNEIYVACEKHKSNSDTVFYMQHIDGPWYLFPFCGAYRCILAVNSNKRVATRFPGLQKTFTLSDGDIVGFDFNREIHYILNNPETNDEPRITLKLHYVVYPKVLKPIGLLLGFLTTQYDIIARNLFNATKKPEGPFWQFMAYIVLLVTAGVFALEQYVGYYNVVYVLLTAAAELKFPGNNIFLIATSFFHYPLYIGTYAQKDDVNFGMFKRNAFVFKTLSMVQLAYQYLSNFELDLVSLAIMAVGYGISAAAVRALGVDRTYFGVELGLYDPKWIGSFPYNVMPHPMIVGSMLGLVGAYKQAAFRAAVPYLVPAHLAGYCAHLVQECVYDIYKNPGTEGKVAAKVH
mmetsp:Transcript_454/g.490  ORF Transcript_454/g.490 Transcript_454/m.490 type:complete len:584 (+) Transcript_454:174-1925(+)|eukprot:CAMPEP_0197847258 /NCGR_PEP_ID=MMETSP1438-20131217/5672_1 /TAXON_ID=1461541 /ORGANISM="Pterosperma sp., Strain CCMP1384" /LENGTH=583 /DNA_ID=CAMNT_0043459129 /DNA_START=168 /DNA_END=1919 /DNA_ORIENTATION=-